MSQLRTIKNSHCLPDNENNQDLAAIHSQTITSEEHHKILLRFLSKQTFTITSLLYTSDFILYVYLEAIEETYRTRSSRPIVRRSVSLLRGNQEYFWAVLDPALDRNHWHRVRCLGIHFDRQVTYRGTYRNEPYSRSRRKRGLFIEGPLVYGPVVESQDKTRKEKEV